MPRRIVTPGSSPFGSSSEYRVLNGASVAVLSSHSGALVARAIAQLQGELPSLRFGGAAVLVR
jgi:hypothetical protein